MTNRTGKREREARSRYKRPWVEARLQDGTALPALKLGRKKARAFRAMSTRRVAMATWSFLYEGSGPPSYMLAAPVAEVESRGKTDVCAADVSEQVSSPAGGQSDVRGPGSRSRLPLIGD
jgi:hypothetical protein